MNADEKAKAMVANFRYLAHREPHMFIYGDAADLIESLREQVKRYQQREQELMKGADR